MFCLGLAAVIGAGWAISDRTALIERSGPGAADYGMMQTGIDRVTLLASRMALARSSAELAKVREDMATQIRDLDAMISKIGADLDEWQRQLIRDERALFASVTSRLQDLAADRLALDARKAGLEARISLLNMQGLTWLDTRIAETTRGVLGAENGTAELSKLADYSELRNLAHRGLEQLRWALSLRDARELAWLKADLANSLSASETVVARLPDSARSSVAPIFDDLATLANAPGGIVAEKTAEADLKDRIASAEAELLAAAARISGITAQFAGQSSASLTAAERDGSAILKAGLVLLAGLSILGLLSVGRLMKRSREPDQNPALLDLIRNLEHLETGDIKTKITVASGDPDVSRATDLVEKLRLRLLELERSNAELDRFASAAAHDLKTPVVGIARLAEWVAEEAASVLSDTASGYLHQMQRSSDRLQTLLSDLLIHGRLDSERQDLPPPPVEPVSDMVRGAFDLVSVDDKMRLRLTDQSSLAASHQPMLRQVLLNLITNSIKHHDKEKGELLVTIDDAEIDQQPFLRLRLVDDGPGIPEAMQRRLKTPITELDGKLGLTLISSIVDQVSGKIDLVSDPKKFRGTAFVLLWPAAEAGVQKMASKQSLNQAA